MSYSIMDILDRLIKIEESMSKIYLNISKSDNEKISSFNVLAKVMYLEEKEHADMIRKIKNNIQQSDNVEIDFFTYDKISQILYEFESKINFPKLNNIRELVNLVYNFEKENLALLINIKGRMVRKDTDIYKKNYSILLEMIEEEKKHVENIKPYWTNYK